MSNEIQQEEKKSKKRYIAIAALACLVATSGTVGAIVTAETKVENNQIFVEENNPDLEITGDPFIAILDMNKPGARPDEGKDAVVATQTWKIQNKDPKANALVKITSDLTNLVKDLGPSQTPSLVITAKGEKSGSQVIANRPLQGGGGVANSQFTIVAGTTTEIILEIRSSRGAWDALKPAASEKFPVVFEYTRGR